MRENAGAIDHDVDVAEFGVDRLGHGGNRGFRRHVAFDVDRLPAGSLDQFYGRSAVSNVDHRDMHAILGETLGKGLPDAGGGAGDDGNFVFVTFGHFHSPKLFFGREYHI